MPGHIADDPERGQHVDLVLRLEKHCKVIEEGSQLVGAFLACSDKLLGYREFLRAG
jgi:hypothetical protein